jgi:CheY-like chemotaxis protein
MSGKMMAKPLEVLLVDDNLEDAWRTIQSIGQEDIQWWVTLVDDGQDGMPFLHKHGAFAEPWRPNVILLDMDLPSNERRRVLAGIRMDNQLANVAVVILTDSLLQEAVYTGEMLQVDGFLTKPLSARQFSKVIESISGSRRAALGVSPVDSIQAATTQESVAIPAPTPVTVEILTQPSAGLSLPVSAV